MMIQTFPETLWLAPGVYLQASAQNFRLHRRLPWEIVPFIETLQETGDPDVTRQMMAGAFYAGFPQISSDNQETAATAEPSLLRHIFDLASSYQTTHATPPTMRRVAVRLAARGQHKAAEHFLKSAQEESGHDTLALMDLAALGLPAQKFVEHLQPEASLALVKLFTRLADSEEPIAVLGYAYALERMAMFFSGEFVAAIERLTPGVNATRCLRVHSAVGSDAGHVAEAVAFIATLPPPDRATIARATYSATSLRCPAGSDYPGDEAMSDLLDEFGWTMPQPALAFSN